MISTRIGFFLDRDGTLIAERDYLSDPEGVELLPGVVEGLKLLQPFGPLVVVSNQSGVARGLTTENDVKAVNARVEELLIEKGVFLSAQYYCPYHPDFGITPSEKADWRKPDRGMVEAAARELTIDPKRSYLIGDKETDLLLARNVGARGVLVRTGYGESTDASLADEAAENFLEAAEWIIKDIEKGRRSL